MQQESKDRNSSQLPTLLNTLLWAHMNCVTVLNMTDKCNFHGQNACNKSCTYSVVQKSDVCVAFTLINEKHFNQIFPITQTPLERDRVVTTRNDNNMKVEERLFAGFHAFVLHQTLNLCERSNFLLL